MQLPNFSDLRPDIDERLNHILHRALEKPVKNAFKQQKKCFRVWKTFFTEKAHGPTNEKLAAYCSDFFGADGDKAATRWFHGQTPPLQS